MPLAAGGSPSGVQPAPVVPKVMPPLSEEGTPTSTAVRRPLFAMDGSFRSPRSRPAPPVGPPPRRSPPDMAEDLDMKLPGISAPAVGAEPCSGDDAPTSGLESSLENDETCDSAHTSHDKEPGARTERMGRGRHAMQMLSTLSVLPESPNVPASSCAAEEGHNRAELRLGSAEITLAARKAQRVAQVRNIAQEVVRVTEDDANGDADENEREEIER